MNIRNFSQANRVRLSIGGGLLAIVIVAGIFLTHTGGSSAASDPGCNVPANSTTPQRHGAITEYPMPRANSDLMYPLLDEQGRVYVGEMGGNRLGRLDPATNTISEYAPPGGKNGIMALALDAQGNVWFAEEGANYIARFTPATCQFKTYALPTADGRSAAPVGIGVAPDGGVWFTQFGNDRLGQLDPATGKVTTYPIPGATAQHIVGIYNLTLDHAGKVWFSTLQGGQIGQFDPATAQFHLIPTPHSDAQIIAITTAPDSALWFSEMNRGVIGRVDPRTFALTEYPVPTTDVGAVASLYDVKVSAQGIVWATSSGANSLFRFDPTANHWDRIPLPQSESVPYGLALTPDGHVWFTEAAIEANRIGEYIGG